MNQAAFTDEAIAYDEATSLAIDVSEKNEWDSDELNLVLADIDAAHAASDDYWGILSWAGFSTAITGGGIPNNPEVFWSDLARRAATWTAPGSEDLRRTFAAATATVIAEEEEATGNSLRTQLGGAAALSAMDLGDVASKVKEVGSSSYTWLAVAALATVVIVVVAKK